MIHFLFVFNFFILIVLKFFRWDFFLDLLTVNHKARCLGENAPLNVHSINKMLTAQITTIVLALFKPSQVITSV